MCISKNPYMKIRRNKPMKKTKLFLSLTVLVMLGGSGLLYLLNQQHKEKISNLSLMTIQGETIKLSDWPEKTVLINFWATDCPACVKEIPLLKTLHNKYKDKGLEIIAISMYYDPPNHVVHMSKAAQIPYHLVLDLKSEYARLFGHIKLIPTSLIISPDRNIVFQDTGILDLAQVENVLRGLLHE